MGRGASALRLNPQSPVQSPEGKVVTLTYRNDRFETISAYSERAIAKGAGFRWDPIGKAWWTLNTKAAQKLMTCADESAQERFKEKISWEADTRKNSRAVDSGLVIPAPDGLQYLPFQKAGIEFANVRKSILIADEMGLGKTIQALGLINLNAAIKRVLVICPAGLKINWMREAEKWLVRIFRIVIIKKDFPDNPEFVIVNYDILKKFSRQIRAVDWDLLICDEAHYIKNKRSMRTKQILGEKKWDVSLRMWNVKSTPIEAKKKIFMTGTPILNRPVELHPLLSAIDPGEWGPFFEFGRRYCDGHHNGFGWDFRGASNLGELSRRLRSNCMVRRLKSEVLKELPQKQRQVIELPSNGLTKIVNSEMDAYEDWKTAEDGEKTNALAALARARKETAVAKMPQVIEHVLNLQESINKVIVWGHHHEVLDGLHDAFRDSVKLDGRDPAKVRDKSVAEFQSDPEVRVFVGGIQAAGVGITLTSASHNVFAELDWVPGNLNQAEDRCHRIGQVNSVLVQHLVLENSVDNVLLEAILKKQDIIDRAVN